MHSNPAYVPSTYPATANNTPVILSVGADETNLEADSNEASGLKWVSTAKDALILAHLGL
ncbi:MAG: hypothetical protein IIB54_11635 [Planctomycetes bacterium]|nr:hypothetical protein [Planctomycetota bacterium]